MPAVAFYVSGHGYGHASRQIEIIRTLQQQRPDVRVVIRTAAPRWMFDRGLDSPFTFEPADMDTGVAQVDSLTVDVASTVLQADAFHRTLDGRSAVEAARLDTIDLVVADVPPLACAAAARAGVPAVAMGNFTWDWIYAAYPETAALAPALLGTLRNAYGQADEAWRLPLSAGFETFDNERIVDIPLVARRSSRDPGDARRRLGLPTDDQLLLCAFGRYGIGAIDWVRVGDMANCHVVATTGGSPAVADDAPDCAVTTLDEEWMASQGMAYEDLLAAVDVVVTKPGYGMMAECAANDTAMIYTARGRFPEYDVLVAGMPGLIRNAFISHADLLAGRWEPAIAQVLSQPRPEVPDTDGAEVAASLIADRLSPSGR